MKSKLIKNDSNQNRSSILSCNNENNYISQISSDKKEYKSKSQNDANRINSSYFKGYNDNSYENFFLKNLIENLFELFSEQNSKEKLYNKIDLVPMLGERDKIPSYEQFDYEKFNQQNNVMYLNKNGELVKNLSKSNIREENLNNIFNNTSNTNSNLNNILAKFNSGNNSGIFKVENENKKNYALRLGNTNEQANFGNPNIDNINKINIAQNNENNFNLNKEQLNSGLNKLDFNSINYPNINLKNENYNNLLAGSEMINFNSNLMSNNNIYNSFSNNNLFKSISNSSNLATQGINQSKKDALSICMNDEDKSNYLRGFKSPNPFEDYNFGHNSNIFNSPNPMEGIMYKLPNETNEKMSMNFNLSRNSSIDYNDIFKSGTPDQLEEKRLPKANNIFYDDSFFSISSNDKKSEVMSEPNFHNKILKKN